MCVLLGENIAVDRGGFGGMLSGCLMRGSEPPSVDLALRMRAGTVSSRGTMVNLEVHLVPVLVLMLDVGGKTCHWRF